MFTIKHGRVAFASKMLSTWPKVVKSRTMPSRLGGFTTVYDFTIVKTQKKSIQPLRWSLHHIIEYIYIHVHAYSAYIYILIIYMYKFISLMILKPIGSQTWMRYITHNNNYDLIRSYIITRNSRTYFSQYSSFRLLVF